MLEATLNALYVAAFFVVPFLLGIGISRALRVKDMGIKLGWILLTISIALAPFINVLVKGKEWSKVLKPGIDLGGGTNLVYQLVPSPTEEITADLMAREVAAVTKRINPAGTKEIVVRQVGKDRVEVIIPGADKEMVEDTKHRMTTLGSLEFAILANRRDHNRMFDFEKVVRDPRKSVTIDGKVVAVWRDIAPPLDPTEKDHFGTHGEIAVRPISGKPDAGDEVLVMYEPDDNLRITGKYLKRASPTSDEKGAPAVGFNFNATGATLFYDLTTANKPLRDGFQRRLAILLDNKVVTAPNLNSPISDHGQITGNFNIKQVEDTVAVLNAGSLPREIRKDPISEFTISPTLGTDVQSKGLTALLVSTIAVVVFMGVYYMVAGVIADFAMLLNLLFIVSTMVFIDAAFTLPGLAGLVLSAGMAVDANVLIYERIREETARGASLRMAIYNGFEKAFSAIFDSNVTTLITSVILYLIGSEQVKGFAVSLFIGLVMNLFTAVYVSRVILNLLERSRTITKLKMMSAIGITNIDFVGKQFVATAASLVLIAVGLIAFFIRGDANYDIDFMGGTMLVMQFKDPQKTDDVRDKIEKALDKNITLEELTLSSEINTSGMGRRYRLRTTDQNQKKVEEKVNETFPTELIKVSLSPGKIEPIAGAKSPAKSEDKKSDPADEEVDAFAGGNRVELTFSQEVLPSTASRYVIEQLQDIKPVYGAEVGIIELEGLSGSGTSAAQGKVRAFDKLLLKAKPVIASADLKKALDNLQKNLANSPVFEEVTSFESSVAKDTRNSAWLAIVLSLAAIIAYLWLRFDKAMYGMAAAIAVAHDVLVAIGAVAIGAYINNYTPLGPALMLTDFKINMAMIAAFLTIVGYSLNDTIVIFDRLREVRGKNPTITKEMINDTVNQTLSRTILTALTVFISVFILYIMGGEGIHGFAFCMVIGTVAGTYSTVYIASPLILWFIKREEKAELAAKGKVARPAAAPTT